LRRPGAWQDVRLDGNVRWEEEKAVLAYMGLFERFHARRFHGTHLLVARQTVAIQINLIGR
jgi:hypothetical protein